MPRCARETSFSFRRLSTSFFFRKHMNRVSKVNDASRGAPIGFRSAAEGYRCVDKSGDALFSWQSRAFDLYVITSST